MLIKKSEQTNSSLRWWSRRARDAQREEEADNRDRNIEAEDLAFALAQERESTERAAAREQARERFERETLQRRETAKTQQIPEEVPVEIQQPEGFVVTRIMTKEERIAAIKELVSTIPADKVAFFFTLGWIMDMGSQVGLHG